MTIRAARRERSAWTPCRSPSPTDSATCASSSSRLWRGRLYPGGQGNRPEGGYQGTAFDEQQWWTPSLLFSSILRDKAGFGPKLIHDVHSHLSGMNAVELARRLQPYQMFYVEDILPPEQVAYYRNIREICTTPQAVGEGFTHPLKCPAGARIG